VPITALDLYLPKVAERFWPVLIELEQLILGLSPQVEERTSYGGPFFYYQQKMFCYLGVMKGEEQVTLGICNGASLSNAQGLLTGGGKVVRHLKIALEGPLPEPTAAILRESLDRLEVAYQMRAR
jgi:hypothetical protein